MVALDRPSTLIAQLGEWVVELRTTGSVDSVLDSLAGARIAESSPLISAGLLGVASARPREELAVAVALVQSEHPEISAAAVRPTTLSDVYHHLTGATTGEDAEATR